LYLLGQSFKRETEEEKCVVNDGQLIVKVK